MAGPRVIRARGCSPNRRGGVEPCPQSSATQNAACARAEPLGDISSALNAFAANPLRRLFRALLSLFQLGPRVLQRHRTVEDQLLPGRVRVDCEIPEALELIFLSGRHAGEARLDARGGYDFQRIGIEV